MPVMSAQRTPPHDLGAEEGALGAAMLSDAALAVVLDRLAEDDFYRPAHRSIYRVLAELRDRGRPVDPTTVGSELARTGALPDVGGAPFLHTLVAQVPTAAHVGEYVATVATLAYRRRLIDVGHRIVQAGYEDPDNPGRAVAHAQAVLADVAAATSNGAVGPRLLAGLRDGAWLDAQHFPPLAYTVPGVIPEGLVLLVGPPKIGKSWFVLAVALAAASGGRVLGLEVPRRPVLYLALEDGDRRIQDRCRTLLRGGPIPPTFEYVTVVEPGRILDTITVWLARHAGQPPLVVLDTLGKVMPPALVGESSYQRDYRVAAALKRIADQQPGMTLLVNHHDRKAGAEDFVDSVSGTHGLAGAADTVVVLTRPRQEEAGRLKVTGRDVAEGEYAVRFLDGAAWTLDGADLATAARRAGEARVSAGLGDRSTEVIAFVGRHPGGATPAQAAATLGMDRKTAQVYLSRAAAAGRLSRPKRGRYAPVGSVGSVGSPGQRDGPRQHANGEVLASPELLTSQANTTNRANTPPGQGALLLDPDSGRSL
jgi:DnaB-like helicase N terminal domain/AAA domain/Transcriptional regulator, AbiEi antitoxin